MNRTELTGKKRYRVLKRWFRKPVLVLQLEVYGFVPQYTGGPSVEGDFQHWWVDAKPEYMLEVAE